VDILLCFEIFDFASPVGVNRFANTASIAGVVTSVLMGSTTIAGYNAIFPPSGNSSAHSTGMPCPEADKTRKNHTLAEAGMTESLLPAP
jgi:hypothetical protein